MLVFLIIFLPLLEIAGFIIVGGEIGVGLSLLWVIADTIAGFTLLTSMGGATLRKAKQSVNNDIYPFEEMFDGCCILIGALLLIFPGFISDLMAAPLLLPPVRRWIFTFLKSQHNSFLNGFTQNAQGFASWYYEEKTDGASTTIEGEFRRTDDQHKLDK